MYGVFSRFGDSPGFGTWTAAGVLACCPEPRTFPQDLLHFWAVRVLHESEPTSKRDPFRKKSADDSAKSKSLKERATRLDHKEAVYSTAFSPDSKQAPALCLVRFCSFHSLFRLRFLSSRFVSASRPFVLFGSDFLFRQVVTASEDGSAKIWVVKWTSQESATFGRLADLWAQDWPLQAYPQRAAGSITMRTMLMTEWDIPCTEA